jgi:small multidrug resistance pump
MNINPIAWLWLTCAIIGEIIGTTSLKASKELTVVMPSLFIVIGYGISFYFMILTMRHLPVSLTYAFWSALGIVFITIISAFRFDEKPDLPAIMGIGLIIAGVVMITMFSKMKAS